MRKNILIVDDEKPVVEVLSIALRGAGYEILKVHSGREALETLKSCQPQLILLDIFMPEMNGLEVLEKIKSQESSKSISVVMISTSGQKEDIDKAFHLGAKDYVTKPFTTKTLLDTVRNAIK